jgi:spore coat polysaccharide biosynthesis protein SpsF (cytidylyltransferase family)
VSPASAKFRAVIQARFGSRRFPGKVLKEFRDKKVLAHVLEAAGQACGKENVVLATSDQSQDDAVAAFATNGGWAVHRGSLEDVWSRFRDIAMATDATWLIRICADSPLMPPSLIETMIQLVRPDLDLITNVHPRTFPHGQSVEILHRRLFEDARSHPKTSSDREHVTPHLYRLPGLRILNHKNPLGDLSHEAWSVEEPADIKRLEKICHG